jgi:hypothetical protein
MVIVKIVIFYMSLAPALLLLTIPQHRAEAHDVDPLSDISQKTSQLNDTIDRNLSPAQGCTTVPTLLPGKIAFNGTGSSGGGGGDDDGLTFSSSIYVALSRLKGSELVKDIDLHNLRLRAGSAIIAVVDEPQIVTYNGFRQDSVAKNYPDVNQIWVNRKRFQAIKDPHVREAVALHELLSLEGIEKTGYYPISGQYLAQFDIPVEQLESLLGTAPPASNNPGSHPPDGPRGNSPPDNGSRGNHPPGGPRGNAPPG